MSEQVAAILDELGQRFGATGAELWTELVTREIAMAYAWAVGWSVVATGLWVWAAILARHQRERSDDWMIVAGCAALVTVGVLAASGALWVTLQAPQAAVIQRLFGAP